MKTILFADSHNRRGKRDGDEFLREMEKAFALYDTEDADTVSYKVPKMSDKKKRSLFLAAIEATGKDEFGTLDNLCFFGHGWPTGVSLGFRSRRWRVKTKEVQELAKAIAAVSSDTIRIGLYACLTGRGAFWAPPYKKNLRTLKDRPCNIEDRVEKVVTHREGFAMLLCSELNKLGKKAIITAALTAGHTTKNKMKVRIQSDDNGNITRTMIVHPRDKNWRWWCDRIDEDARYRFDIMFNN